MRALYLIRRESTGREYVGWTDHAIPLRAWWYHQYRAHFDAKPLYQEMRGALAGDFTFRVIEIGNAAHIERRAQEEIAARKCFRPHGFNGPQRPLLRGIDAALTTEKESANGD